jgi:hypothetical protein
MSSTFPTRFINVVDIPEPQAVKGTFQYNFFEVDERSDDTGSNFSPRSIRKGEVIDIIDDLPRFVKVTWKPVALEKCWTGGNEFISKRRNQGTTRVNNADILNATTVNFIQSEQTFSNFDYVAVNFQDSGIDGKLFKLVSGSANMRGIKRSSLTDVGKSLNDYTRETVNGNILVDAVNNKQACGILYTDDVTLVKESKTPYEKLRDLMLHTQINNKIVGTLVRSVAEDSLNIYADEMSLLVDSAENLQSAAIEKLDSTSVSSLEWDIGFVPIHQVVASSGDRSFEIADSEIVGYVIDKIQIDSRGREIKFDPIIVKGNQATSIIDPQVVYGGVYKYTVKAVSAVTLLCKSERGRKVKATGLVSSQPNSSVLVNCIELTPPPPPADFKVTWDYSERSLRLLWSFPVNRQRDIKYFQIFRRASINEPYELLRQYDFDDSTIPAPTNESIRSNLNFKLQSPRSYFYDREFTKDSKYIYTICSVDAHGLSSNYSIQYEVTFDRFSNKVVTKVVSNSGAPKAYPNMYLLSDTFVDTIKTSEFDRLTVYFDPEYLKVTGEDGQDLNLIPLNDPYGAYKVQMINTDFQSSQTLTFTIDDRRKKKPDARGGKRKRKYKKSLKRSLSGLR